MKHPFFTCLRNAHEQGQLTLEEKQRFENRFKQLLTEFSSAKDAKTMMEQELVAAGMEKERRALKAEESRKNIISFITRFRNRNGQQDIAQGWRVYNQLIEDRQKAIIGRWMRDLDGFLEEFKKGAVTGDLRRSGGLLGNTETVKSLENVVRELFGENSKDPNARVFAKAWEKAAELARQEFNELGGSIAKLEKWGMPQTHQPDLLFKYGREKWVDRMMQPGVLNRERMVDGLTGKPLSDAELKESLTVVWGRITSDGFIDMDPSMTTMGKGALYKQHQDSRFIHFANADEWMKYAKEFGNPDFYASMISHLEMMSRDVAAMQFFGPNPEALRNYTRQFVSKFTTEARTLDAIRVEQMAEIAKLSAQRHELTKEFTGNAGEAAYQTTQSLHAELSAKVEEIDKFRSKADLRKSQADRDKMQLLHEDLDRINKALHAARNDPFYGLGQALPLGKMIELQSINQRYLTLIDEVRLDAVGVSNALRQSSRLNLKEADNIWDVYRGTANAVHDYRLANAATAIRNVQAGAKLGSAMVSALADATFQKLTRTFLGMKQNGFSDVIKGTVENFSAASRAEAVRSDIVIDTAMHTLNQSARFAGALNTTKWSAYAADRSITFSGLPAYTEAQKRAFAMEWFGHLGDHANKSFQQLPAEIKGAFRRQNFTAADWEAARKATLYQPNPESAPFLRPAEIEAVSGRDVALKYSAMMYGERRFAIIEPDLRARAMLTQGIQRGTWAGEMLRGATQFKSFPVTIMLLHGGRLLDEIAMHGMASRNVARYAFQMLVIGTMVGAVVVQLKDIIAGRDPRTMNPMENPAFWGQALLQSGGLGIWGDFIQNSSNRYGGGAVTTLFGPTAGTIGQTLDLTIGNMKAAAGGQNANIGNELTSFVKSLTPGASTWYARKAIDAYLFDNLQKLLTPNEYGALRRRIMDKRAKEYSSQGYWWEPLSTGPSRAPNLGAVVGR